MRTLSKFLLAILLLTVASVGWGACPTGKINTYCGCEADPSYVRKLPDSELLNLCSNPRYRGGAKYIDASRHKVLVIHDKYDDKNKKFH